MSQLWTITSLDGKTVFCERFETSSSGVHPKDRGWAWNAATQKAWQIQVAPDVSNQVWSGTAWVDDIAKLRLIAIAQVKAKNEQLVKSLYSQNYGKQKKYSRKQAEAMDFRALAPTVLTLSQTLTVATSTLLPQFSALTSAAQKKKFRFAMAQAARRTALGTPTTPDTIVAEIEAAIDVIEDQVAMWEAIELEAVKMIKAAPTRAAIDAIIAALGDWSWKAW